jgi:hypothetical protein
MTRKDWNQYYLYLNSNDSRSFYPENDPSDFRIRLPKPLNLKGDWECALLNISFWPDFHTSEKPKEIYICLEEIANSYAMDNLYPILRRISIPENLITKINLIYPQVDFVPVTQSVLQSIRLYIMDNKGLTPSFMIKDLYCTLLLRRKTDNFNDFH